MRFSPTSIVLLFAFAMRAASSIAGAAEPINFNRDIRPILSDKCFHCHGPDEEDREEELRLDVADGKYGALSPRDGYHIIKPGDPEESELWFLVTAEDDEDIMPPPKSRKERLTDRELALVKQWIEEGGAYQEFWSFEPLKASETARVAAKDWNGNFIDRRVMARLEAEGRQPKAEADKRTLIRRLSFDLTGLPPTIEEIDTYLEDERPGAYERLVDRLMVKPAYGEHMARYWADLVRLADTNGMHKDFHREFATYRDWLIRSFNDNLPFDNFIRYQLAGDLYEDPNFDQLIASGFNRLHMIIDKGTALPEESLHKNVIDRVEAFGTAFLGLTVQCAQCHDHKYDPITRQDYYQLYAFFNNFSGGAETVRAPERGLQPPFINLATPKQNQQLANFDAVEQRLDLELESMTRRQRLTEKWGDITEKVSVPWIWDDPELESKSVEFQRVVSMDETPDVAIIRFVGMGDAEATLNGESLGKATGPTRSLVADVSTILKEGKNEIVATVSGKAGFSLILEYRIDQEESRIVSDAEWNVRGRGGNDWKSASVIDELADKTDWTKEVKTKEVRAILAEIDASDKARKTFLDTVPAAMIMSEMDPPRQAYMLTGGAYDAPEQPVERNTPAFLPPLPDKEGLYNRMDLANWLVARNHPLTARVTVNRIWQQIFGVGLVKTSEDFGAQGEWPSHPELLDDLALSFLESGWDVKELVRDIVVSNAYRQSSDASPSEFKEDPENRLLARGSRYRLDAEALRDQILAVSGQLNETMYGKSVKPPQPPGLWEMVSMSAPFTYVADTDENIYRRSLYSYWRRGMPPPQMTIMNAPSREFCVARRERTNTPLQALLFMNEEEWFNAAKKAALIALESTNSVEEGLRYAYERVTSHEPSDDRLALMRSTLEDFESLYRSDRSLTESLTLEMGTQTFGGRVEVAAWTMMAHSLFNLELTKVRR
ncbi:MAG: hypothetical protein CBD18_06730 [Opitutales bacterium TMED158]|nr:MAG: hypothetical protein CBD18_06730 [Opitutales bacterium TMED158]